MKQIILLGLLFTLPAAGFSESSRGYRSYPPTIQRATTVRTTTVAPTFEVYRSWDRNRDYRWNEQRYHWDGGTWIVVPDMVYGYRGGYGPSSTLQDDVGETSSPDREVSVARTMTRVEAGASTLIADVQRKLARRGYYRGSIDGIAGSGTRSAIAAYQADHGMDPNGYITRDLEHTLGR